LLFVGLSMRVLLLTSMFLFSATAHAHGPSDFDEANALKDGGACDEAVIRYQSFIDANPEASEAPAARYNQGVCFEELMLPTAAFDSYTEVVEDFGDDDGLRADARFRIALIHVATGEVSEARRALAALQSSVKTSPQREIVDVQIAWLDAQAGRSKTAAKRLAVAVPVLEAAHAEDPNLGIDVHLATASVAMGDLVGRRALEVKLGGDHDAVMAALDAAAETAAAAEAYYVDALRLQNPTWASAAALHVGTLYVTFHGIFAAYRGDLNSKTPKGWTLGQARALDAWLGDRMGPILIKARQALTICTDIRAQVGRPNRFTKDCEAALGAPPL
jgi:tetratricopeptide (TPR) repeat protein